MGTSLTGLTPATTYDALIKVDDNGPLSATAKYLSDGLGNDSVLSLSTSKVGIGTNTPNQPLTIGATNGYPVIDFENSNTAYGDIGFQVDKMVISAYSSTPLTLWTNSNERMRITSSGNVGIGLTSPNFILETAGTTGIGVRSTGVDGVYTDILSSIYSGNANEQNAIQASVSGVASDSGFRFQVSDGSGLSTQTIGYQMNKDRHIFYANGSERVRITTNGLTFNGDTAAANALDDYEEGTFTPTLTPSVSGSYTLNTGLSKARYTKIGNTVSITGFIVVSSVSSPVGTIVYIGGLPFTIGSGIESYGTASVTYFDAPSYAGTTDVNYFLTGTTRIEVVRNATTIGALDEIYFTTTYFV